MFQELVFLLLFLFFTLLATINNAFINALCIGPYVLKLLFLPAFISKTTKITAPRKVETFFFNFSTCCRLLNLKVCGNSHFHQKYMCIHLVVPFSALFVIAFFVVDLISLF